MKADCRISLLYKYFISSNFHQSAIIFGKSMADEEIQEKVLLTVSVSSRGGSRRQTLRTAMNPIDIGPPAIPSEDEPILIRPSTPRPQQQAFSFAPPTPRFPQQGFSSAPPTSRPQQQAFSSAPPTPRPQQQAFSSTTRSGTESVRGADIDGRGSSNNSASNSEGAAPRCIFLDENMSDHQSFLSLTIFLFLIHYSSLTDTRPLSEFIQQVRTIAEIHSIPTDRAVADLCELLGSVSVVWNRFNVGSTLANKITWETALEEAIDASDMYDILEVSSADEGHGHEYHTPEHGSCWSPWQWAIVQLMSASVRNLEVRSLHPNHVVQMDLDDMNEWFKDESAREEANRSRRGEYISWFTIPVAEKIARLGQVVYFLENRLPAWRDREGKNEATDLSRRAERGGFEMLQDFAMIRTLADWFRAEKTRWEEKLHDAGNAPWRSIGWSGFPTDRALLASRGGTGSG